MFILMPRRVTLAARGGIKVGAKPNSSQTGEHHADSRFGSTVNANIQHPTRADTLQAADLSYADALRELDQKTALMALEAKATSIRRDLGDTELVKRIKAWQARVQAELSAIHERHALERKARKRGEHVPDMQADPEVYVLWLQRQRALPYVQLARDLAAQSRHSR